jgi:hypothetical protein
MGLIHSFDTLIANDLRAPADPPCARVRPVRLRTPATLVAPQSAIMLIGRAGFKEIAMKRFVIERDMPGVGTLEREQMREGAQTSNAVLKQLGPDIQWVQSFVTMDRIYCIYLAKDEALIRKHAELSGFPANKISEVRRVIDPTTAVAA